MKTHQDPINAALARSDENATAGLGRGCDGVGRVARARPPTCVGGSDERDSVAPQNAYSEQRFSKRYSPTGASGWFSRRRFSVQTGSLRKSHACVSVLLVVLSAALSAGASCNGTIPGPAPVIVENDHLLGSPDAPVTVVEYASPKCSWCALFATTQFAAVRQRYIDTGKVRWVHRHLLPMSDADALRAGSAAECAGDQRQYFEMLDLLFQHPGDFSADAIKQLASDLALDRTAFDACLDGGSKTARVQQDVDSGLALGVTSTPRFFVDDEMVVGYRTADQLGEIIDRHLAE